MTLLLIIYAIVITVVGFFDYSRIRNFDDFILAGRSRGTLLVAASILASVIGASATMGVVQLAFTKGPAAVLWLGSGAVGLLIAALFIVQKIRGTGAGTFTDVAQTLIGANCARLITFIIIIAWTGIIAAQYIATAKIVAGCCDISYVSALLITAGIITSYCAAGGQFAILKTDLLQFVFIILGLGMTLFFLFRQEFSFDIFRIESSDTGFSVETITYYMLIVGSCFVIGPDIFGRFFAAGSNAAAKKAGIISAVALGAFSVAIVSVGLWARRFVQVPQGQQALIWILQNHLPPVVGAALTLGLLSATISSASTCIVTVSSIVGRQIKGCNTVVPVRVITAVIGIAAFAIAYLGGDIIKTLLLSYSIFNCGVIPPLFLAIIFAGRRNLSEKLVIPAMILGGSLGVYSTIISNKPLTLAAFAVSAALAAIATIKGKANS